MDLARWSRRAEWALAASVVVLHLGIFLLPERSGRPELLVTAAHDAQLYSAIVLILAWAVLGPGWLWLRIGALPLLVGLWYLPWNTRMFPRETAASFPAAIGIAAAVLVVMLRCFGQRVKKSTGRERGAQFSLLALLAMTTLIAAAVGLLEWLRPMLSLESMVEDRGEITWLWETQRVEEGGWMSRQNLRQPVMSAAVAISAVGAVWVVLRPGAVWLRLAAMAIGLAVFGTYQAHLLGVASEQFTEQAINLSLGLASVAALTAITVLPLRMMDFRLQRLAKAANTEPIVTASNDSPMPGANRTRLLGRVAALLGLLVLIAGGIPVLRHFYRPGAQTALQSPSQAFAHWMSPRQNLVIWWDSLGSRVDFTVDPAIRIPAYLYPLRSETTAPAAPLIININGGWEARQNEMASPPTPPPTPAPNP